MSNQLYRETKWLRFILVDRKPKTVVMHVVNKSGKILGEISWLAQWRQYTFDPKSHTTERKRKGVSSLSKALKMAVSRLSVSMQVHGSGVS